MIRAPLAAIACIVILLLAWPGYSQQSQDDQQSAPVETSAENLINLDFRGGTATDYVQAVRKAAGDANIIVMTDLLDQVQMPPARLQNVDVWSAIRVLLSIPRDQADRLVKLDVGREQTPGPRLRGFGRSIEEPVYIITAETAPKARRSLEPPTESSVIDLSEILGDHSAKDVLTAVETSLELLQTEAKPAQIRFHEQTGLLIARGTPDQMFAVKSVVQQLQEKAARTQRNRSVQQELLEMRKALEQARDEAIHARSMMENAKKEMAGLGVRYHVLEDELNRAKNELARTKDSLEIAKEEVRRSMPRREPAKTPAEQTNDKPE